MSSSEHTEINDLIARVFDEMGGRATKGEVLTHVRTALPEHLRDYLLDQGLATKISGFFRTTGESGLPQAPAVDGDVHVQLQLLSEEEYRYIIAAHMKRSYADRRRAQRFAEECAEHHGVLVDIDDPYNERKAS